MAIEYVSNTQINTSKKAQQAELLEELITFIADGGKVDVYDTYGNYKSSHVDIF
jgi:hypothetical protein